MDTPTMNFVRAGSLEELKAKGRLVVHGPHRPILLVHDKGPAIPPATGASPRHAPCRHLAVSPGWRTDRRSFAVVTSQFAPYLNTGTCVASFSNHRSAKITLRSPPQPNSNRWIYVKFTPLVTHGQPVSAAFIRPESGSGPEPRRDLLDQPRVAIGIGEARERPVAGALGVGPRLPRLDRKRRAVPDFAGVDALTRLQHFARLSRSQHCSPGGRSRILAEGFWTGQPAVVGRQLPLTTPSGH